MRAITVAQLVFAFLHSLPGGTYAKCPKTFSSSLSTTLKTQVINKLNKDKRYRDSSGLTGLSDVLVASNTRKPEITCKSAKAFDEYTLTFNVIPKGTSEVSGFYSFSARVRRDPKGKYSVPQGSGKLLFAFFG